LRRPLACLVTGSNVSQSIRKTYHQRLQIHFNLINWIGDNEGGFPMKRYMFCAMATVLCGCTPAANQVLGDNAIVVDTAKAQQLKPGRIYQASKNGTYSEKCANDFKNKELKLISTVVQEDSDEQRTDDITGDGVNVSIPGVGSFQMPYYKLTRVDGYKVTKAVAPEEDDLYGYIRKYVNSTCRKMLDQRPLIVIVREARAKKTYKLVRAPVKDASLGVFTTKDIGKTQAKRGPNDVTFGMIAEGRP
jgi:hypothetical protein